jgi:hypothetical protein
VRDAVRARPSGSTILSGLFDDHVGHRACGKMVGKKALSSPVLILASNKLVETKEMAPPFPPALKGCL